MTDQAPRAQRRPKNERVRDLTLIDITSKWRDDLSPSARASISAHDLRTLRRALVQYLEAELEVPRALLTRALEVLGVHRDQGPVGPAIAAFLVGRPLEPSDDDDASP